MLTIGPFGYDPADQCLWKDGRRVDLTPKTSAVLDCLVSRAGRLVTKEALIEAVWPGVCVTDAVLKVRIAELRRLLGEGPGERRFIETLHRRGYRLVAPVGETGSRATGHRLAVVGSEGRAADTDRGRGLPTGTSSTEATRERPLVGREPCLERLIRHLDLADSAERQLVFLTGESGAGKTALLRAFCRRIETRAGIRIATGQCVEHHGAQEAFLPVLDALEKLCRTDGEARVAGLLRRYAPTWLAQIPWLLPDDERDPLARDLLGATRSRMTREFGTFCEVLTQDHAVVLVLEDLHWCDYATVELLSWLASQQGAARLLVLVSLRPAESNALGHPLEALRRRRSLQSPCAEISVDPLGVPDIERYLHHRLPRRPVHARTADWLHRRTGGNPLFVVNLVAYLQEHDLWPAPDPGSGAERASSLEDAVPDTLKRMIAAQIERLDTRHQELLLAASIAGDVFCAGVLGAALGEDAECLDEACRRLSASGQFIRHFDQCELPDGTRTDRYAFIHVLYRDGLSQSLSARRRGRLHRRVGAHKARVYAGSTHLIAAELVTHFERAGSPLLAIRFLRESADNALARCANRAAVCHLTSALELLERVPDDARAELEPALLERRGLVYQTMADMRSAVADFERLLNLAGVSGHVEAEVRALLRLASALSWTDRERCLAAVDETRRRCRQIADDAVRLSALGSCAYWNLLWRRWDERDARDCLSAATHPNANRARSGATLARASYFLCLGSDYARAADMADEGMSIALGTGDGSEYLLALYFRCWALLHAGRWDLLIDCLDEQAFRIADSNDHRLWNILFSLIRSWLENVCGDHDAAYRSASCALARAERGDLPFGRLLGLVRLGFAAQGLGRDQEAHDAFARCQAWLADERVLMDWIVSMPMHLGLGRHWLKAGDLERARSAAGSALRLAEVPGERTYVAEAFDLLASIGAATDDPRGTASALERASRALDGADAPLVSWRIDAAHARLAESRDDTRGAATHWSSGARTLERLAATLGERPALRRAFEDCPSVRTVLARARATGPRTPGRATAPRVVRA